MKKCLLIVFICALLINSVANTASAEIASDMNLTENTDEDIEEPLIIELETMEPEEAHELKIIARYGNLPNITTFGQEGVWLKSLLEIRDSVSTQMDTYMNNGEVAWYGICLDNRIHVAIYENVSADEQLLDEIYTIFNQEATKKEIHEVPVVFVVHDPNELVEVLADIAEESEVVDAPIDNSSEPAEEQKRSVPGFQLLTGLIALTIVFLFKRVN